MEDSNSKRYYEEIDNQIDVSHLSMKKKLNILLTTHGLMQSVIDSIGSELSVREDRKSKKVDRLSREVRSVSYTIHNPDMLGSVLTIKNIVEELEESDI